MKNRTAAKGRKTLQKQDVFARMMQEIESTPPPQAPKPKGPVYEVLLSTGWQVTSKEVFQSWRGGRRLNGSPYTGPIFMFGSITERYLPTGV